MRRLLLAAAISGLLIATGPTASARKWTSIGGQFSTEAELVEVADGQVTLKKSDGQTITVPTAQLSLADRRYLATAKKKLKPVVNLNPTYTHTIQPFLATYCVECHNQKRAEDGYAADTYAALTRSGKKGALVVPSKPAESLMIQLFQPGRKHMPPDSSPQPTADQIAKVIAWVTAGAEDDTAAPPTPQKARPEKGKPRR